MKQDGLPDPAPEIKGAPDVGSVAGEESLWAGVADCLGIFRLYKAALVPGCKPQLQATFQLRVS